MKLSILIKFLKDFELDCFLETSSIELLLEYFVIYITPNHFFVWL
jgi:hypothetical protein